jgi:hypothetical protein
VSHVLFRFPCFPCRIKKESSDYFFPKLLVLFVSFRPVILTQAAKFIIGKCLAAGALTVVTEFFRGLPQFVQENIRLVPQIRAVMLSSTSFQVSRDSAVGIATGYGLDD